MKKKYSTLALAFSLTLFAASCGGGEKKKDGKDGDEKKTEKKEVKTFSYNHASTLVKFESFKYTDKTGVGGQFDSVTVDGVKNDVQDLSEMFGDATFEVYISSINTKDTARDRKIAEHFFGTMKETDKMTGSVKSLEMKDEKGTGVLNFKMNNQKKELPFELSKNGRRISLSATMDVKNWGEQAAAAVDALNEACKDLHTGEDGKSKLWSEVDIEVQTALKEKKKTVK